MSSGPNLSMTLDDIIKSKKDKNKEKEKKERYEKPIKQKQGATILEPDTYSHKGRKGQKNNNKYNNGEKKEYFTSLSDFKQKNNKKHFAGKDWKGKVGPTPARERQEGRERERQRDYPGRDFRDPRDSTSSSSFSHEGNYNNNNNNNSNYKYNKNRRQMNANAPPFSNVPKVKKGVPIEVEYEWGMESLFEFMNVKLVKYDSTIATIKSNGDVILTSNGYQNKLVMRVLNQVLFPLSFQVVFLDGSQLEDKDQEGEGEEEIEKEKIWTVKSLSYNYQVQFQDEMQISAFASRDWYRFIKFELQKLPTAILLK